MTRFIPIAVLVLLVLGCSKTPKQQVVAETKRALTDSYIYELCDSIINHQGNFDHVWNFIEVDSGTIERHDVQVMRTVEGEQVITVQGFTGCSSGCTCRLLLVFEPERHDLIHVSQVPIHVSFPDFDRDGTSEVLSHNIIMWMGTCREYHALFDLETDSVYFSVSGSSPETCGLEAGDYGVGDTLLHTHDLLFQDVDNDQVDEIILTTKIRTVWDSAVITSIDTIQLKD